MVDIQKETVTTRRSTVTWTLAEMEELLRQHAENLIEEEVDLGTNREVTFDWDPRTDNLSSITVVLTTTTRSEDE